MARLCDAVSQSKSDGFELAFLISLGTGARKMEIWKLLWNQVDVETGLITLLKTKNGERCVLKVSGNTLNELKKRKLANPPGFDEDCDYVFKGPKHRSNSTKYHNFEGAWINARREAGLEQKDHTDLHFVYHDLRHSAATMLVRKGYSLKQVGAVLGHRTQSSTERYTHLITADVVQAFDDLGCDVDAVLRENVK